MTDAVPPSSSAPSAARTVGPSTVDLLVLWAGIPALGAGLAYGVLRLAGWYTGLPWAPFQGPARLVDELLGERGALGVAIALGLGALAGAVFAGFARRDIAVVTVAPERASVVLHGTATELDRAEVTSVYVDRKALVVLGGPDGAGELAHAVTELGTPRLADAFRAQGWPWCDEDPYAGALRRWVPGDESLPASADAVLRARAVMLEAGTSDDVADLRRELSRLGVVVRDVDKKQYWRPARPGGVRGAGTA
ncbi:YqeB family protein [Oerskovia flava]|uniref:YqeB family protein n=1 Tax=Oerskovia flava TaxID=2986422 RepID=UPI00223F17DF|nr:hypothetical protein [Oerskovia sp. JB1-3-2]